MPLRMLPEPTKGVIPIPKAPRGARPTGEMTAHGDPIWEVEELVIVRDGNGRPVKDPVLDPEGKPRWRKHPTTGEALYPIERIRQEKQMRRFVLHIERNERGVAMGSVTKQYHFEPDPEEKERVARAARVREFQDSLAERAVERGVGVDELLDQLTGARNPPGPAEEDASYPKMRGVGKWALSAEHEARYEAGEIKLFQGTKAAAQEAAAKLRD